jgi:hypothetical protein
VSAWLLLPAKPPDNIFVLMVGVWLVFQYPSPKVAVISPDILQLSSLLFMIQTTDNILISRLFYLLAAFPDQITHFSFFGLYDIDLIKGEKKIVLRSIRRNYFVTSYRIYFLYFA